jgi:hypothetical protein
MAYGAIVTSLWRSYEEAYGGTLGAIGRRYGTIPSTGKGDMCHAVLIASEGLLHNGPLDGPRMTPL